MRFFNWLICPFFLLIPFIVHANNDLLKKDPRYASLSCKSVVSTKKIICDYRISSTLDIVNVNAKIGKNAVQIAKDSVTSYPAPDQSTTILFLVDSSDPNRKSTVEKRIVSDIFDIFSTFGTPRKPHLKLGLAVFDTNLKVISQIGDEEPTSLNSLSKIKAEGQATEFYKSIIDAISLLSKTDSTRKGLIIFSDGKDEDRAYKKEDVLKAAKDANIVILALGYAEKPADTPYLQTLKKLGEETYGQFYDATNKANIEFLLKDPLAFIDRGGRVILDSKNFYGKQKITLELGTKDGKTIPIESDVLIDDTRTLPHFIIDFVSNYWFYILAGLLFVIIVGFVSYRAIKKSQRLKTGNIEYAYLSAPDGFGTKYSMNKTAVRIGRGKDNDICLLNDSISLHHAEIHRRRDGTFYIVDLSSSNGIYVNSRKVNQNELKNIDEIELGEVKLIFHTKS